MHSVSLEDQKTFTATEIKEVTSFSDKEVVLVTKGDTRITVSGDDLKINVFLKSNGAFSLSGNVNKVCYRGAKENILKKILK